MQAKKGDKVAVHYTGRLTDGQVFDSSVGREPLDFELGSGALIKGFENAVYGMQVGDTVTVNILPEEGYGFPSEDMYIRFEKADIPEDLEPEVGMGLTLQDNYGRPVPVVVSSVAEDHIILDANHTLAGKELVFEISLVSIG